MNYHSVATTGVVLPPAKIIDIGGVQTSYHVAGSGRPIVFIYGGNFGSADSAPSAHAWNLNFVPLAERFQVIAFDKIGQGFTGNPLRDEDYSMAAVVRHAAAFMTALKLPPAHVVGHSRGGFAATRLALEYPHLVRALTIVSSGTLSPRVSTNEVALSECPHPPFTRESARWIYEGYCFSPSTVTEDWIDKVYEVLQLPKYRESVKKIVDQQLDPAFFFLNSPSRNARPCSGSAKAACSGRPKSYSAVMTRPSPSRVRSTCSTRSRPIYARPSSTSSIKPDISAIANTRNVSTRCWAISSSSWIAGEYDERIARTNNRRQRAKSADSSWRQIRCTGGAFPPRRCSRRDAVLQRVAHLGRRPHLFHQ